MLSFSDIIENYSGIVIFIYNKTEYCTNVKEVVSILAPEIGTQKSKDSINIKGNEIPLLKLEDYFSGSSAPKSERNRVLVVDSNGHLAAFEVDSVKEIITFDKDIAKLLEYREVGSGFLNGRIIYGKKEFLVPDYESIINEFNKRKK